jgi:hypothetical protein
MLMSMLLMLIYDVVGVVDVVQRGLSSKEVVDFADVILLMLSMLKLSSKEVVDVAGIILLMLLMLKLLSKGGCRPNGWSSMVVYGSSRLSMLGGERKEGWGVKGAFYTRISNIPTRPFGFWPTRGLRACRLEPEPLRDYDDASDDNRRERVEQAPSGECESMTAHRGHRQLCFLLKLACFLLGFSSALLPAAKSSFFLIRSAVSYLHILSECSEDLHVVSLDDATSCIARTARNIITVVFFQSSRSPCGLALFLAFFFFPRSCTPRGFTPSDHHYPSPSPTACPTLHGWRCCLAYDRDVCRSFCELCGYRINSVVRQFRRTPLHRPAFVPC